MSLTALPVTADDLLQLQTGIQFFTNPTEAASEATKINAPGATETVFTYAAKLLNDNLSTAQVAMATTAIMESGAIPAGDANTPNTLTYIATKFLPAQVAFANEHGFNPTVYAAEAAGLALANTSQFEAKYGNMEVSAFIQAVGAATGVDTGAIKTWVDNWTLFYAANVNAVHVGPTGLTAIQEAYGAAFGDAIGVALIQTTPVNLKTHISSGYFNFISGSAANALVLNAEGSLQIGASLQAQVGHQLLQGESNTAPGIVGIVADHIV